MARQFLNVKMINVNVLLYGDFVEKKLWMMMMIFRLFCNVISMQFFLFPLQETW